MVNPSVGAVLPCC